MTAPLLTRVYIYLGFIWMIEALMLATSFGTWRRHSHVCAADRWLHISSSLATWALSERSCIA